MRTFENVSALKDATGEHLGFTEWREVTQDQVNLFADATGDHQWIHIDEEKAKTGPFGTTIAHGFLSLSMVPALMAELIRVGNVRLGINYGLNKVRFPAPVPVGSRIRAGGELADITETAKGTLATMRVTIEVEGSPKPACVAETLSLYVSA